MGILQHMVTGHLRKEHLKQERPMRNQLHPSTIGMCERRIVFDMMVVPKTVPDDRLMLVFENGHSMHHRYQELFSDMGILVAAELSLARGKIGGHTDALIKIFSLDNPAGEEVLVELKSAAEKSFKWMKEKDTPKTEHKAQLQFYMHLSGVHKGILFVENKDTQETWEFPMTYDPKYGEELEKKAYRLIEMAQARKLPDIPKYHTPSSYKCSICDYNFYCHAGNQKNNGEVRFPIPFREGSVVYVDALSIINAMQGNQPIPDVTEANTNGELAREVERKNHLDYQAPSDIISNYIKNN